MKLPIVNKKQLQTAVFTLEMKGPMASYATLCQAVANTEFGRRNSLLPEMVAHLLFEHGIICKTAMPDPSELPSLEPTKVVDTSATLPKVVDTGPTLPKVEPPVVAAALGAESPVGDLDFLYDEPPAPTSKPDPASPSPKKRGRPPKVRQEPEPGKPEVAAAPEVVPPKKRGRPPKAKSEDTDGCCLDLDTTSRVVADERLLKIAYPAGRCPHKLDDLDPLTVLNWVENVRSSGVKQGRWYLASALRYFAREFFDINGPQWPEVCDLINQAAA